MTNLPATLSTLQNEISVLTDRLRPAAEDQIAEAMQSLLAAGLTLPSSMDPARAPAVYEFALSKVSKAGLKRAISKLIRGEYEHISRSFIPTPPELSAMARAETRTLVDDLARARARLASLTGETPPRVDPASRERVLAKIREIRGANDARKDVQRGYAFHDPMPADRAAYWQKIQQLQDAPEVNVEQQAFRRRVENSMPKDEEEAEGWSPMTI